MNTEAIENDDAVSKQAGRNLQLVRAGSSEFAIFADEISTIVAWQEPTPLPNAPSSVLGVVSIQGRMLTVLDLATLPGLEATLSDGPRKTHGHIVALRGDEHLALAIEAPGEVIPLASTESLARPDTVTRLMLGVLQREGAEIKILNPKGLFPAAIEGRQRRNRRF